MGMKISLNFTLNVPEEDVSNLLDLTVADTRSLAREFVKNEAVDLITGYLNNFGVRTVVTERSR